LGTLLFERLYLKIDMKRSTGEVSSFGGAD